MSRPAEAKEWILTVLFAWPLAVAAGWVIAHVTHTDWPAAALPIVWLALLYRTLAQYAQDVPSPGTPGEGWGEGRA